MRYLAHRISYFGMFLLAVGVGLTFMALGLRVLAALVLGYGMYSLGVLSRDVGVPESEQERFRRWMRPVPTSGLARWLRG